MARDPFGSPADADFAVDLTGVTAGGGRYKIPEATYHGKCTDVTTGTSKQGNPMFIWTFTIIKGEHAGKDFKMWTALSENALWKVSETLVALGVIDEPGKKVNFKKSQVVGKECLMSIVDGEYQGKPQSDLDRVMRLVEVAA